MNKLIAASLFVLGFIFSSTAIGASDDLLRQLCNDPDYTCIKVQKHQTWDTLFSDPNVQDMVMRINRMNTRLTLGMTLAIPLDANVMDLAPFDKQIEASGEKLIVVSPNKKAWAAYDPQGQLVHWGPASGGAEWCPDIQSRCRTPIGEFRMYTKGGEGCVSSKYPIRPDGNNGGAPTPYCMFFHKGFAIHGSFDVPGYNASHGCIRGFPEDARWLNEEFIDLPKSEKDDRGTKVIIESYHSI